MKPEVQSEPRVIRMRSDSNSTFMFPYFLRGRMRKESSSVKEG
jgi:hypothetical protein